MLRIGFDGRALASPAAGMRRYARELFGALAVDPAMTIVAVGSRAGSSVPPGVEVVPAAISLPTNLGWMTTGLPRTASRANLDLFHAPSYTAPVGGPRPLVLTIHDVSFERHPEWYPYKRDPVRRAFYRRSARAADRIVTDSAFSKREIVEAYNLPPERIDVVPLAAGPAFSEGAMLPLDKAWPSSFVVHVGDLHPRRNLSMVARALARVRERNRSHRACGLILAGVDRGSGPELSAIEDGAGGAAPLVTFAGHTDESVLLALYRSAAALVYPSRYEGFGLPLVEAMSCGTPVIAARSSSIPEVVGDAAVLLDPDDGDAWSNAIERVLEDEQYRNDLRRAGLARAREFSWTRTARETAAIYRRLLGEPVNA
ncbi:MAG TPA: glycosyltransferase family 1 protein [Vicinamibacterales bacterium]